MPKQSAGLLLFRRLEVVQGVTQGAGVEVFLVHPGGPFWAKKNLGAWSIPKGEYLDGEEPLAAALREFEEETGFDSIAALPRERFLPLGTVRQNSGKMVSAWSAEVGADIYLDPAKVRSNLCEVEWPPRSGRRIEIPEVDRAAWFTIPEGRKRIFAAQSAFLDRLMKSLGAVNK
jgi:predicted NUDIX family NTP pyrophosphohydrolase